SNALALHPPPAQRAQLRNQAIAAMSLPDLVPSWTLENTNAAWNGGSIDLPRSRYALVTAAGGVEVRRVPDNVLLFTLPARDAPAHLPNDFSPDGKLLAIYYANSRVAIWDLERREVVLEAAANQVSIETVAFSPDSARVAIGDRTGRVAVWDLAAQRQLCAITNEAPTDSLVFDLTGQRLAIGLVGKGHMLVVDARTGITRRVLHSPAGVRLAAWHPVHPLLAAGCSEGFV